MSAIGQSRPFGFDPEATTDQVREAEVQAKVARKRPGGFSLTKSSPFERRFLAPLLAVYLGYTVVRLGEVFPVLAVPRLQLVLMALILGGLLLAVPQDGWKLLWRSSRALQVVGALLGLAVLTIPLGIWMSGSWHFLLDRYVVAVSVFLACVVLLRDPRVFRTVVATMVIAVTVVGAYSTATFDLADFAFDEDGEPIPVEEVNPARVRITVGESLDANDWGAVLATVVPLALWLSAGSVMRRLLWLPMVGVMFVSVVTTGSRGALVGFIAVAAVLVTVGSRGLARFLTLGVLIGGASIAVALGSAGNLDRMMDIGTDDYNLTNEGRWYFWRQGIVWMIKRPWGYGIGNFPTYFDWLNGQSRAAHSLWVQYGVELGVLGLALIILLVVYLFRGLGAMRRNAHLPGGNHADATLAGHLAAALTGMLVTSSFLSNAYKPLTYMAFGLAAAALLRRPADPTPTTSMPAPPPGTPSGRGVQRLRRGARRA